MFYKVIWGILRSGSQTQQCKSGFSEVRLQQGNNSWAPVFFLASLVLLSSLEGKDLSSLVLFGGLEKHSVFFEQSLIDSQNWPWPQNTISFLFFLFLLDLWVYCWICCFELLYVNSGEITTCSAATYLWAKMDRRYLFRAQKFSSLLKIKAQSGNCFPNSH